MERRDCLLHDLGNGLDIIELTLIIDYLDRYDVNGTFKRLLVNALPNVPKSRNPRDLRSVSPYIGGTQSIRNSDRLNQAWTKQRMFYTSTINNADDRRIGWRTSSRTAVPRQ